MDSIKPPINVDLVDLAKQDQNINEIIPTTNGMHSL